MRAAGRGARLVPNGFHVGKHPSAVPLVKPAFCSTRGGWKPLLVEGAGRLPSRRPPAAAARGGGQGRPKAGTGPARSHAQRPLGREHGEHGEDPPLDRSEHRGITQAGRLPTLSPKPPTNYRKPTGYLLPGCPAKCPCFSLQSARAFPCKVPVDNLSIHRFSPLALLPLKAPSRRCQCALSPAAGCAAASSPARPTRCRPPGIGCARPARSAGTRL